MERKFVHNHLNESQFFLVTAISFYSQEEIYRIFYKVAPYYDRMNDVMSLGFHRCWKKQFLGHLPLLPNQFIIDSGCGSGNLGCYLHQLYAYLNLRVVGIDPNTAMIAQANHHYYAHLIVADGHHLPFPSNTADVYITSFALRNMTDPGLALREAFRVLRDGGVLGILEFFSSPSPLPTNRGYIFYKNHILPLMGHLFAKDGESYEYLGNSIDQFLTTDEIFELLSTIGFSTITIRPLAKGICHSIVASKPYTHHE